MALIEIKRTSKVMMNQTLITVALPDDIQPGEQLRTVWLFHGLGDNGTVWARKAPVEQYALDHRVAIVMPGFDRSFYVNMAFGSPYGDYLEQELLPAMRALLPLSADPAANVLIGNSMGGYGSLRLAFRHPQWFSAVGVMSAVADLTSMPTFMPDYEAVFGIAGAGSAAAQLPALLAQADLPAVKALRFYQVVGEADPFRPANDVLARQLKQAGLNLTYEVAPGAHSWAFWQAKLPPLLDWALG